jgi:hypothetical protein
LNHYLTHSLTHVLPAGSLCCDEVKGIMMRLKGNIAPSEVELKNAFFAMDKDGTPHSHSFTHYLN